MDSQLCQNENEVLLGNSLPLCSLCGAVSHFKENCTAEEVVFLLPMSEDGAKVELFTSVDGWMNGEPMRALKKRGMFALRMCLFPGSHEFKFRVNSIKWVCSPFYQTRLNQAGETNNIIKILPCVRDAVLVRAFEPNSEQDIVVNGSESGDGSKKKFNVIFVLNYVSLNCILKAIGQLKYEKVEVWGSWNGWATPVEMEREYKANEYILIGQKTLLSGYYLYKFKIDGQFCLDIFRPDVKDGGFANHFLELKPTEDPLLLRRPSAISEYEFGFISSPVLSALSIHGHTMDVIGEDILVFGGYWNGVETNAIIKIGNSNRELKVIEAPNQEVSPPSSFHTSMTFGQKLVVFGRQSDQVWKHYYTFYTPSSQWRSFNLFQTSVFKRRGFASAYRRGSGRIYFFGGYFVDPATQTIQLFADLHVLHVPILKLAELRLRDKSGVIPRHGHSANFIGFQMVVFGGKTGSGKDTRLLDELLVIDMFDHERLKWKAIKAEGEQPAARFAHASEGIGNFLYIYGGDACPDESGKRLLNDLWELNLIVGSWRRIQLPGEWRKGRVHSRMASIDDTLFIFGGLSDHAFETDIEKSILTVTFSP